MRYPDEFAADSGPLQDAPLQTPGVRNAVHVDTLWIPKICARVFRELSVILWYVSAFE